jgi:hypothetical protein
LRQASLVVALALLVTPVKAADFSGLVDIGGGRKMYLECSGTGSPAVVLISGKGSGAADWSDGSEGTSPCEGNEPLYELTYQITRVNE